MVGRTHDLIACTALCAVIAYGPPLPPMTLATAVAAFGANFIGGLFPDIDQPTSDLWDNFRTGPLIARIVCKALGGHRHLSHSLIGVVLIGLFASWFLTLLSRVVIIDMGIVWYAFMIGVVSHILADMPTKEGVPLLWPLRFGFGIPPLKLLRIKSGSFIETSIIFPGFVLLCGWIVLRNSERFLALLHSGIR